MKHRFLYIMALLLTVATGTWAQDPDPIDLTPSADGTVWTLSTMPEYDTELEVTYYTDEEVAEMEEAAFAEGVKLTYDDATGTWMLAKMPGFDVELEVEYKADLTLTVNIEGWTFGATANTPTVSGNEGSGAVTFEYKKKGAADDSYSTDVPTDAGEYTVRATVAETDDYVDGTATADFTIAKADITMTTAPAAVSGLVYSGEAQTLITAGVASFGTILYSTDGENFSDALPQGTAAGTYTVYYKVEGDDNHNAFAAQTLNVTITDKTALNNAITEAEAYYSTISESNPDAAAVLQTAINTAKGVQGNANATQSEVDTAAQTLNEAVDAAKADVALKRITLVIPAKSYVSRIDADKRQIENAVAGVSLYSVNSVTNTEVVLTGELTVIAAEMPYFIYNDNDTEVEVSIVVSSEDADNVEYDSEHFKGTLVDKTFTDEDMQAADHYVLSNGHDFVWVKDAGTLAAGKCWIQLPKSPANARALSIVFEGETTGISTVNNAAANDAAVYDLQGRRVMQPTKGLFIVGGKKVVIK